MEKNRLILRLELWNSYNMVGMQLGILNSEMALSFFFPIFEMLWFRNNIEVDVPARLLYHLKTDLATIWVIWQISNTYSPF